MDKFIDVYHDDQCTHQFIWMGGEEKKRYTLSVDDNEDAVFITRIETTLIYEFYQWDEIKDVLLLTLEGGDI